MLLKLNDCHLVAKYGTKCSCQPNTYCRITDANLCIHVHTCTSTHTYMHVHRYINIHTYIQTCTTIYLHMLTCIYVQIVTYMHNYTSYTFMYTYTRLHACIYRHVSLYE